MALPKSGNCKDCPAYRPIPVDGFGECRCDVPKRASADDVPGQNRSFPVVGAWDWCLFGRVAMATDAWPST